MTQPPYPPSYPQRPGPPYPAQPPQRPRKSSAGIWIILGILGLMILLCGSCSVAMFGADDSSDTSTTRATYAAPPPAPRTTTPARPTSNVWSEDEIADMAFLMSLDKQGIKYSSDDAAITLGHTVCDGREAGVGETTIALTIMDKGGYSAEDSGYIVGAAISAYCPELK